MSRRDSGHSKRSIALTEMSILDSLASRLAVGLGILIIILNSYIFYNQ